MRPCRGTQIGRFGVSDMLRQRIDGPAGPPPHYPAASYHHGG
jgi:hypothetical protein